jgi:hypothetical protein
MTFRAPDHLVATDVYDSTREFRFATQGATAKYGCGPLSVAIVKELLLERDLTDDEWKVLLAGADIHVGGGVNIDYVIQLLGNQPRIDVNPRSDGRLNVLIAASADNPVIINWAFDKPYNGTPGHFNVCLGLTKEQDGIGSLIVLDPAFGLNYIAFVDGDRSDENDIGYYPMTGRDGDSTADVYRVPGGDAKLRNGLVLSCFLKTMEAATVQA